MKANVHCSPPPAPPFMRDAPYMPELEHHVSSGHVDRLRHQAPTADLLGAVDPWRRNVAWPCCETCVASE